MYSNSRISNTPRAVESRILMSDSATPWWVVVDRQLAARAVKPVGRCLLACGTRVAGLCCARLVPSLLPR